MKSLVIYTTMYGNTEKIARAIGGALSAEVLSVQEASPNKLSGIDLLVVSSPTQAFNMLPAMKTWLKSLPKGSLNGVKVAAFDTRLDIKKVKNIILTFMESIFGYAAEKIGKALVSNGGTSSSSRKDSLWMHLKAPSPPASSNGRLRGPGDLANNPFSGPLGLTFNLKGLN